MSGAHRAAARLLKESEASTRAEDIFAEEPPPLTVFIRDRKYLNNPALSDIQYDAVRHIEQIFYPATYDLMSEAFGVYWDPVRFINQGWLQWGKGSGKDHICRIASARVANLLLCLRSPQRYFGMPVQDSIHTINVATSAPQASRAFYEPLRKLVSKSPWFSDKCSSSDVSIVYDKNIETISGHSSAETQEGLNIILAVLDEIAAFRTKEEAMMFMRRNTKREPTNTADHIVDVLWTSIRTRFPQCGKLIGISYPRYLGDFIQRKYNEGVRDNEVRGNSSRTYVSFGSTWDVNPRVSKEDLQDDYEAPNDPAIARAKYECKPEYSINPFMVNTEAVRMAFNKNVSTPPVVVEYYWGTEEIDGEETVGWQVRFHFSDEFKPAVGARYAMHGDIALEQCSAGVAMAHVVSLRDIERHTEDWEGGDVVVVENQPVVKLDFITSFDADMSAKPVPRDVQIRWFRKLCWELMTRGFNIRSYTFDGFASHDIIQVLKRRGIESKKISTELDNMIFIGLRDLIYDGRLEAYYDELSVKELIGLSRMFNGRIMQSPGGSKDRADAIAGACHGAEQLGGYESVDDSGNALRAWPVDQTDKFSVDSRTELPADLESAIGPPL